MIPCFTELFAGYLVSLNLPADTYELYIMTCCSLFTGFCAVKLGTKILIGTAIEIALT